MIKLIVDDTKLLMIGFTVISHYIDKLVPQKVMVS